jgi:hypothetical protein
MARHKTNLLYARAYKNRLKRKEASILSSEQEMKAGFVVMTQEQCNSHPSGRVILLPSKRVGPHTVVTAVLTYLVIKTTHKVVYCLSSVDL